MEIKAFTLNVPVHVVNQPKDVQAALVSLSGASTIGVGLQYNAESAVEDNMPALISLASDKTCVVFDLVTLKKLPDAIRSVRSVPNARLGCVAVC